MNGLRSQSCSEPFYLRFINNCDTSVDILWINLSGRYHIYGTLKPQQFLDVNTFTRHYWVFQETQSRTPLMANNKWHFCGAESGYPSHKSESPRRYIVLISRPIVTKLRSICINFLCNGNNALKQCSDVKYLEIPVTLKEEIVRKIHARDLHSHGTPA